MCANYARTIFVYIVFVIIGQSSCYLLFLSLEAAVCAIGKTIMKGFNVILVKPK